MQWQHSISAARWMHCTRGHLSICSISTAGGQCGCWDHGDSLDAGIRTPTIGSAWNRTIDGSCIVGLLEWVKWVTACKMLGSTPGVAECWTLPALTGFSSWTVLSPHLWKLFCTLKSRLLAHLPQRSNSKVELVACSFFPWHLAHIFYCVVFVKGIPFSLQIFLLFPSYKLLEDWTVFYSSFYVPSAPRTSSRYNQYLWLFVGLNISKCVSIRCCWNKSGQGLTAFPYCSGCVWTERMFISLCSLQKCHLWV